MKFAKRFNIFIGSKRLTKEDKEDVMKNIDTFVTAIAIKKPLRNPSVSAIPNEVTV